MHVLSPACVIIPSKTNKWKVCFVPNFTLWSIFILTLISNHLFSFILFLVSYLIQFVPTLCLFQSGSILLFIFYSTYVCLCLILSIYVPLLSSVYFLSLLSALCSIQFLISFLICFYSFLLVIVCCSMWVLDHSYAFYPSYGLWVESGWSLPYLCHLYMHSPRQHCLGEPKGYACIPDSTCLHSYKGLSFSAYQWVQFKDNTHLVFLCLL